MNLIRIATCFTLFFAVFSADQADAQQNNNTGVTIQQPTVNQFSTTGAVMVPDGGSMSLGGLTTSSSGLTSRGVPFLSSIPYFNRLFRNQAVGRDSTARNARVHVKIISLREMQEEVLAEAARRQAWRAAQTRNPNGTAEVQKKAAFITRNIGNSRKRR